ncbi:MAG: aconitase family protein [Eggerthellaceae bacterium]
MVDRSRSRHRHGQRGFRVPSAIRIELTGELQPWVCGKDVILHIIGTIGVDGALYQSMEFCGDGVKSLSMDDRFSICNMAIEAGAKNGIFPVDEKTRLYMKDRVRHAPREFTADDDASYERTIRIDLRDVPPTVAAPHLPENTKPVTEPAASPSSRALSEAARTVVSKTCAWRSIMRGRHVADGVGRHRHPRHAGSVSAMHPRRAD